MRPTRARLAAALLAASAGMLAASAPAHAVFYPRLYTSTRAQGMGGAYSAVADDESAIFLNPAGLAGIKGFTFNYAAVDIEMSTDTVYAGLAGATALNNLSGNTLNQFMGKDLYVHAQITPTLVMPGFGLALISDGQFGLLEQNYANPNINLGYQITNGIQMAYGTSVLPKRFRGRQDFRVGIAGKLLWRRGGFMDLGVLDLINLTQDPIDSLHAMTGAFGRAYGMDLGTQYLYYAGKRLTLSSALVMTDVGDTTFSEPQAAAQKSNMTLGFAASYKLPKTKFTYSFDYQHMLQSMDFRSHMHTGIEVQMPFITVSGGLNQMNLSYGASFDLWLFRITASHYGEELATFGGQNTEDRYALRIALKFGI